MAIQGVIITVHGQKKELSPTLANLFHEIEEKQMAGDLTLGLGLRELFGEQYFPGIDAWYDAYVILQTNSSESLSKDHADTITHVPGNLALSSPSAGTFLPSQPTRSQSLPPLKKQRSGFFKRHFSLKKK